MPRIDKETRARLDGMLYAYRRIKEIGAEEFEKELRWRGAYGIGLPITPEEIRNGSASIEDNVYQVLASCSCLALHDEFDFEQGEIKRYLDRFNAKIQGLNGNYVDWSDYVGIMAEETGVNINEISWER